jgi:hypothetical protein
MDTPYPERVSFTLNFSFVVTVPPSASPRRGSDAESQDQEGEQSAHAAKLQGLGEVGKTLQPCYNLT